MYNNENDEKIQVNLPEGTKELVLREGAAPAVFDYRGINYVAYSTESFIELAQRRSKDKLVIAYNEDGMQAILDDTVKDRPMDTVKYDYRYSRQYGEWKPILAGTTMAQKDLMKFMKRRDPDEVEELEKLMYALQNFRFVTQIEGDFSNEDNNNFTFMFKTKDGEGSIRVPKVLNANIEILNESGFKQAVEIEVEVNKPTEAGKKPTFSLECPKLQRYIDVATDHEVEALKASDIATNVSRTLLITGKLF